MIFVFYVYECVPLSKPTYWFSISCVLYRYVIHWKFWTWGYSTWVWELFVVLHVYFIHLGIAILWIMINKKSIKNVCENLLYQICHNYCNNVHLFEKYVTQCISKMYCNWWKLWWKLIDSYLLKYVIMEFYKQYVCTF